MKNILIFSLVGWVLLGCSLEEKPNCDYGYTNTKEALASCHKAAEQGEALAQIYLGNKYQHGKGEVIRDFAQAVHWYKKAAEQGWATAQYDLGQMYFRGEGVTQDYNEAFKWFKKAAEQGDAKVQHILGAMYDHGKGVVENDKQAIHWYRKAAEQNHAPAQSNLGVLYAKGEGVMQDFVVAHMWFNIASLSGYKKASEMRALFTKYLTSTQRSKSEELAKEWVAEQRVEKD